MRNPANPSCPGQRHGFSARPASYDPFTAILRLARHWFRHATDRAIGAQLCDLRLNPFLFLTKSGC